MAKVSRTKARGEAKTQAKGQARATTTEQQPASSDRQELRRVAGKGQRMITIAIIAMLIDHTLLEF